MGLFYSVCLLSFFPDLFQDPPKLICFKEHGPGKDRYRFEGCGRIRVFSSL